MRRTIAQVRTASVVEPCRTDGFVHKGSPVRCNLLLCVLVLASLAYAKEPKVYQAGKVVQMNSVSCGTGDSAGADSSHKKSHELLCREYVLQADRVLYHIRPTDNKHPVLLPISDRAQFRIEKDKMLLRVEDFDNKEREYVVVSITARSDASAADASPAHVNHLQ
jgi:hypothetical protein